MCRSSVRYVDIVSQALGLLDFGVCHCRLLLRERQCESALVQHEGFKRLAELQRHVRRRQERRGPAGEHAVRQDEEMVREGDAPRGVRTEGDVVDGVRERLQLGVALIRQAVQRQRQRWRLERRRLHSWRGLHVPVRRRGLERRGVALQLRLECAELRLTRAQPLRLERMHARLLDSVVARAARRVSLVSERREERAASFRLLLRLRDRRASIGELRGQACVGLSLEKELCFQLGWLGLLLGDRHGPRRICRRRTARPVRGAIRGRRLCVPRRCGRLAGRDGWRGATRGVSVGFRREAEELEEPREDPHRCSGAVSRCGQGVVEEAL
mmetsp:Transcript_6460/g.15595  ORF Transcript_6460/g.15595 Transcript_6460/m.15595 type:complete len:327 (-) Transcript_6460:333-1313(-)